MTGSRSARIQLAEVHACVDVGGSGAQTVVFEGATWRIVDGAHRPDGALLAMAVPGAIDGLRVAAASSLGWSDVDPADAVGIVGPPDILLNDAEAAALGEWVLAGIPRALLYVGLGTGVGGALVDADGRLVGANLLGHRLTHPVSFGDRACLCGKRGCLETVVAGWALPTPLGRGELETIAEHLARAIATEPHAHPDDVVLAGGMIDRHPDLVDMLADRLPERRVRPTARPPGTKSAAAWGLRHALEERASR